MNLKHQMINCKICGMSVSMANLQKHLSEEHGIELITKRAYTKKLQEKEAEKEIKNNEKSETVATKRTRKHRKKQEERAEDCGSIIQDNEPGGLEGISREPETEMPSGQGEIYTGTDQGIQEVC